jgi:hypothetical protein
MRAAAALSAILVASWIGPAIAGGPAWDDMVADPNPGVRFFGSLGACSNAISKPQEVAPVLQESGWKSVEGEDGNLSFEAGNFWIMFSTHPGFCMFETSDMNTTGAATFMTSMGFEQSGTDASGCAQFQIFDSVATLTGGGNDPACASTTEATLRFEAAP